MFIKRFHSHLCGRVGSKWFFSDKFFFHMHKSFFFEGCNMTGQIPIRKIEQFFQRNKINAVVYHKCTHNSEANAIIESFVEIMYFEVQVS